MMRLLTKFLRLPLCIMLLVLAIICGFFFPFVISFMIQFKVDQLSTLTFAIGVYASAIGAFIIIFFTWRLLYLIDKKQAFSSSSLFALNKIKISAFTIAVIYTLLIHSVSYLDDIGCTPEVVIVNFFLIGLGITIGVFANLLEKICRRVLKFQTENELTI